jgi:hypothetical protein
MEIVLLRVADAIDRTGPVIRDQQRSIGRLQNIVRPAEIVPLAGDPAGRENLLLGMLAVRIDDHTLDAAALIGVPLPRPVFGDEDIVLVLCRELIAGVELHAKRSHVGAQIDHRRRELTAFVAHREFRVGNIALMAMRIAGILPQPADVIELVTWCVVAQPVACILGEPVVAGTWIDIAADAVPHTKSRDLRQICLEIDMSDLGHAGRWNANVEWQSKQNVHPSVLVRDQVFPSMRDVGRHVVLNHDRLRHLVEIDLGITVTKQLVDGDDV